MAKETEITVQVFESLQNIDETLKNNGFMLIEHYFLKDYYFSKYDDETLGQMQYCDIIKNSLIIRNINENQNKMVFKNKTLDENNVVIAEEKISVVIDSSEKACHILSLAGLNNWCNLTQEIYVYQSKLFEIGVQVIEGLGIFIEYEEDESMQNMNETQKINEMVKRMKTLNLKLGDDYSVKKVYQKFKKDRNQK